MRLSNKSAWIAVTVLSGLMAGSFFGQDQKVEKGVRLPVARTQDDGGVGYEPVLLKTAAVHFFERKKEIWSDSELVDYTLNRKDDGHLSYFSLTLRPEPARWKPAPGGGQQAGPLAQTKWTIYDDLDGDSVLDTMRKVGPKLTETYILCENTWVQVENSPEKWGTKPTARSGDVKYFFQQGVWKR